MMENAQIIIMTQGLAKSPFSRDLLFTNEFPTQSRNIPDPNSRASLKPMTGTDKTGSGNRDQFDRSLESCDGCAGQGTPVLLGTAFAGVVQGNTKSPNSPSPHYFTISTPFRRFYSKTCTYKSNLLGYYSITIFVPH